MPKKKKQKDKVRKHFKFNLERLARHLGKIADNTSFKDIQEIALNAVLAYAGYEVFKDWKGALFGPISLKLAQAPGGVPPISQITGVAGLALLGLQIHAPGNWFGGLSFEEFRHELDRSLEHLMKGEPLYVSPDPEKPPEERCPEGFIQVCKGDQAICVDSWREAGYKRWGWHRCP